jgi:hypothetical protein
MLRPRESRELRLMSHVLTITPTAAMTWSHDVFGNAVAMASFTEMASILVIDSVGDILLNAIEWPVFPPPPGDAEYRRAQGLPPNPDDNDIMK